MKPVISGDTYETHFKFEGFNPSTSSCSLFISGPQSVQVAGVDAGDGGWNFRLSPQQTSFFQEGTYTYAFRLYVGQDVYTKAFGALTVKPNPADTTPREVFAEKMVKAIERVLEGQLSAKEAVAIQSMSVGGRSLTLLSREELLEERGRWIRVLKKMRGQQTGLLSRPININSLLGNR